MLLLLLLSLLVYDSSAAAIKPQCLLGGTAMAACGPATQLSVKVDAAPSVGVAGTKRSGSCILQDQIEMTSLSSRVISSDNDTVLVQLNVSFPSTADSTIAGVLADDSDAISLDCTLTATSSAPAVILNVSLTPFTYFPADWAITDISVLNENGVGLGATADLQLKVNGSQVEERLSTITGDCTLNNQQTTSVVQGKMKYVVQTNDSDVDGIVFKCVIQDGAGNSLTEDGKIIHEDLEIDGSQPTIDTMVALFSTDKPAHIGSVISITLSATNRVSGYTGSCKVNGIEGHALIETENDGLYMTQYTVAPGDARITNDSNNHAILPLDCLVRNDVGTTAQFQKDVDLGFEVDTKAPRAVSTALLFVSDRPAHEGSIIVTQITLQEEELHLSVASNRSCLVNNVSVASSFTKSADNAYILTYVVGKGEANWRAGELSVYCVIQDQAGNKVVIDRYTDKNTLLALELKPVELDTSAMLSWEYLPDKLLLLRLILVAAASHAISKVCPQVGLPPITGYLLTGILVGPYVLDFLSLEQLRHLRIFDELSLAYIGITAGTKLHWTQMRPMLKSILVVTLSLTVIEYIVGTLTVAVLAGDIDFLQNTSDTEKYAIALLAGCMMIARSPSSALAVIEETGARGHFTTLIFAVTVMCDVMVILLFNVNSMITESFLSGQPLSATNLVTLMLQLCGSIGAGILLGKILAVILSFRSHRVKRKSVLRIVLQIAKQLLLLMIGLMVFIVSHIVHPYLEPLLCCMVAGAVMWNASTPQTAEELEIMLKKLADIVYVIFFTITGATLALDMFVQALVLSIILCFTRILAIGLGSFLGGTCAGESRDHNKVSWMAYITQAGVTLGLAKQIQLLYPGWGSYFSTMIVAVVICNQLLGPPLLRYVLQLVNDAKKQELGKVDGLSSIVLSDNDTMNANAILRMETCGWCVHAHMIETYEPEDATPVSSAPGISLQEDAKIPVKSLLETKVLEVLKDTTKPVDVAVVMMKSDQDNFHVIRALTKACHELRRLRVLRVVVQAAGDSESRRDDNPPNWAAKFANMPHDEEFGDTIDVVVVDRMEATEMLIELAMCGKVINTPIALDDADEDKIANQRPVRTRWRRTVNRLMLV